MKTNVILLLHESWAPQQHLYAKLADIVLDAILLRDLENISFGAPSQYKDRLSKVWGFPC